MILFLIIVIVIFAFAFVALPEDFLSDPDTGTDSGYVTEEGDYDPELSEDAPGSARPGEDWYANGSEYESGGLWIGGSGDEPSGSGAFSGNGSGGSSGYQTLLAEGVIRDHLVRLKGDGTDTVTVLLYLNGSNLESDDGEATEDLSEIVKAGSSDRVNFLVQTMGTKKWDSAFGISSKKTQRYRVKGKGLELVDDSLSQLDCTDADTLADFISWGAANYPADRYILILWDHGGGPVYGFGYDEFQSEEATLTVDEMQTALKKGGVFFDFIGMDSCIMSCMEITCALYDYCDYMILSEDFESGLGWSYTGWVKALNANSSISTPDLARILIDDMVEANESSYEGDKAILALIDEAYMKLLYAAWTDFAYENETALLESNYSQQVTRTGRAHPLLGRGSGDRSLSAGGLAFAEADDAMGRRSGLWEMFGDLAETAYDYYYDGEGSVNLSDYYITDIMAVAQNIDSDKSDALSAAIGSSIVYVNSTSSDDHLTGLSITLPYGDSYFYSQLREVFLNSGFEDTYVDWLEKFVSASGGGDFYDYSDWDASWDGWDSYDDSFNWEDWEYYSDDEYWDDYDDWGWSDWDWDWYGYDDYEDGYQDGYYDGSQDGCEDEDEEDSLWDFSDFEDWDEDSGDDGWGILDWLLNW